tara:strand:- start:216 stop:566 length:351 start_codon:yes stop_codon:yes gene_type:complete
LTEHILFPQINHVEKNNESLILSLTISSDIYYFLGHFPQAPILPGVVQVHWVLHFIQQYFGEKISDYQSIEALKFQVIIAPEYQVKFTLKKMTNKKYSFNYSSSHGTHSSGRVIYS